MTDSIDWTDQTYRTLDELARLAFPGTGVTADTLKRLARKGQLTVYRPGRVYISNLANVAEMMQLAKIVSAERSPDRGRKQGRRLAEFTRPDVKRSRQHGARCCPQPAQGERSSNHAPMTEPRLITGAQAAAYCGVTPTTFAKWVAVGRMPKPVLGTRRWDRKAIDHVLDEASGITTAPNAINEGESAWREWERNYEARKAASRPSERQQNAR